MKKLILKKDVVARINNGEMNNLRGGGEITETQINCSNKSACAPSVCDPTCYNTCDDDTCAATCARTCGVSCGGTCENTCGMTVSCGMYCPSQDCGTNMVSCACGGY